MSNVDTWAAAYARRVQDTSPGILDRAFFGALANTGAIHETIRSAFLLSAPTLDGDEQAFRSYVVENGPRGEVDGWASAPYPARKNTDAGPSTARTANGSDLNAHHAAGTGRPS